MKQHILILFALALSLTCFGQAVTTAAVNQIVTQKLDSFSNKLDSLQMIDMQVSGTAVTTLANLSLPVNTACKYTIDYQNEDAARKMTGFGQKVVFITNWNGVYSVNSTDPQPYLALGTISPGPMTVKIVGGMPLLQVGNAGVVIGWRAWIDKKVKPL